MLGLSLDIVHIGPKSPMSFSNKWSVIPKQAWDCIYLDFAKAFDSVPHKRLLNKLQAYGITGKLLKWVEDFLTDRQQRVIVAQENSSWTKVMSGIPQGSVLGPLLFIVFINDLPSVAVNSLIKIFADDTKVFKAISTIQDAEDLQTDIDKLTLWAKKWQLPYNELKCKVIHYGKRNINHNYTMNGYNLQTDTEEKDLGVTFDRNLTFQPHIGNIISKANSRVGIIKRTFNKLNEENFKILYKSLVRPILEYCTPIWFPLNKREAEEIEKVQRRATKLVSTIRNKTYEDRIQDLNLTTLYLRRKRTDMIQTFKILKDLMIWIPANFLILIQTAKPEVISLKSQKKVSQQNYVRIVSQYESKMIGKSYLIRSLMHNQSTPLNIVWRNIGNYAHMYLFSPDFCLYIFLSCVSLTYKQPWMSF